MRTPCIIVTYNPAADRFASVLAGVAANTGDIIVVDNGSRDTGPIEDLVRRYQARWIPLGENKGIAAAQNIGVRVGREAGALSVWLSDQDTLYTSDFLVSMQRALVDAQRRFGKVACVAPEFIEQSTGRRMPFIKYDPFSRIVTDKNSVVKVGAVIASGMIIPMTSIEAVGGMREDLFIDCVDFEWCWRATRKGFVVCGTRVATIAHSIGDKKITFACLETSGHSPVRHYFMTRNSLYLALHTRLLSPLMRIEVGVKALVWAALLPLAMNDNRGHHLRWILMGIYDGLLGRLGPARA